MSLRLFLGFIFSLYFYSNAIASQSCEESYLKTSKSFEKASLEVLGLSLASPVLGLAAAVGGPVFYVGKEFHDLGIMFVGSKDNDRARLDAFGRVVIKNPRDAIASMGSGLLASILGLPGGLISAPKLFLKSRKLKIIGRALQDLSNFRNSDNVDDTTFLGDTLNLVYRRVNYTPVSTKLCFGRKEIIPKKDFVDILKKLDLNHALCPEGSVYTPRKLYKIIRGFYEDPNYLIPESIYKKSDWFQVSIIEYIKNFRSYELHTRKLRMAGVRRVESIKSLYEGRGDVPENIE